MTESLQLRIGGIVQGVGFRPYVYNLAEACGLNGYVLNDASGVTIAIEGSSDSVASFMARFSTELPPLARIDTFETFPSEPRGYQGFEIRESAGDRHKSATVSPDMAICGNCLAEMRSASDRRHGYWLINCTDCGPRYSITRTVPYDRINTSMNVFDMCPACRSEYNDPADRRYHAQPISCYECGPGLLFWNTPNERSPSGYANAKFPSAGGSCTDKPCNVSKDSCYSKGDQALTDALVALKAGKIVAVKGLGGFHLMCDATNEESVRTLRERKRRPSKPFAVMFPDMQSLRDAVEITQAEAALIDSKEKPVVLVRRKVSAIAASVAPDIDRLGVFLPYTPLQHRIFEGIDVPLVATSANMSDEPIIRSDTALTERLGDVVDGVLSHDREIVNACDDSVVQMLDTRPLMLRFARGFAPYTLTLPFQTRRKILAVGANQKNSIALAFDNRIVLSPYIGDLGSLEAFEYFERTLETFKRFYDFKPDVIVCDKHPAYETSKWARTRGVELIEVQHHYAHMLAVMAEYGIGEKVLGFAFDGTGYGDDGTVWGGEVFACDGQSYERRYTLKPFRLPGGEKAVREPRRVALGLLFECFGLEEVLQLDLPTVRSFDEMEIRTLHAAWLKGINAPVTSSVGRLFDGVASLLGICQKVSYEGESGLLLEAAAGKAADASGMLLDGSMIDWSPMLREIVSGAYTPESMASSFMASLAEVMTVIAKKEKMRTLLSGGVFQNRTLLERVTERFEKEEVGYVLPSKFPVNDGAIALGQAWYGVLKTSGQGDRQDI